MKVFEKYLAGIDNPDHRIRTEEIFAWVADKFPTLEPQIKWNTPMFTDHGTYHRNFHSEAAFERCTGRGSHGEVCRRDCRSWLQLY